MHGHLYHVALLPHCQLSQCNRPEVSHRGLLHRGLPHEPAWPAGVTLISQASLIGVRKVLGGVGGWGSVEESIILYKYMYMDV